MVLIIMSKQNQKIGGASYPANLTMKRQTDTQQQLQPFSQRNAIKYTSTHTQFKLHQKVQVMTLA